MMRFTQCFVPCFLLSCGLCATSGAQDIPSVLDSSGFTGGVLVHLGCAEDGRTAALCPGDTWTVQGLDTSAEAVRAARRSIRPARADGRLTVATFDGRRLPYVDNMVNLLVVDVPFSVAPEEMMRVLCPEGVLLTKKKGRWSSIAKPRPARIDEWTHYLHDPAGTMVGQDEVVGPPRGLQWVAEPKWLRNHEFMSSMHAMVSSGGRVFYILDEGLGNHLFLPPHWTLIARDAFNGSLLWKRDIKDWQTHIWPMKSGPGHMPRRLVAVGDRVYVTLGFNEPVTAIDAATGKTVHTYQGTKATEEIVAADGVLYLLTDPDKQPLGFREELTSWGKAKNRANTNWGWTKDRPQRTIVAVEAESGRVLWSHTSNVAPLTLTVGPHRVFLFDGESLVALDRKSGAEAWVSESLRTRVSPATGYTPRMVFSDGVLVFCHTRNVWALSADAGKLLWRGKLLATGHNSPNDIFIIGGLVWSAATGKVQIGGTEFQALDLHTGQVKEQFVAENPAVYFMHQRCYPGRATQRYIMTSGTGTEFYELGSRKCDIHHYVRGSCIYGLMPSNGLLYKPPDSCACHYQSKVADLCALAPGESKVAGKLIDAERLVKGPVFGIGAEISGARLHRARHVGNVPHGTAGDSGDDWPVYRHDSSRSGSTSADISGNLKRKWQTNIGGKLSPITVADGKAYVAAVDRHTVYALDTNSGDVVWKYAAGGRVDSPPTIHRGTVLFGSADGWVYCLRAADGTLEWRFSAAPGNRQLLCYGQLESLWPVHGSVLVYDDTVYCLAGRNMFFDGGMRLLRLEAASGKKISETVLDEIDPATGLNLQTKMPGKAMPVANPDILSCDGTYVYMGAQKFDLAGKRVDIGAPKDKEKVQEGEGRHLFCPTGFLDDNWFHRSYWIYGLTGGEGHGEYVTPPNITPVGRLLVFDDRWVFGFRSTVYNNTMHPRPGHFVFAAAKDPQNSLLSALSTSSDRTERAKSGSKIQYRWVVEKPALLAHAMTLAGNTLLLAGPPDVADEETMFGFLPGADDEINRQLRAQEQAWQGKMGARLQAVSAVDGGTIAQYELEALPVWDAMAVAHRSVFLSLQDGSLVCFAGE